MQKMDFLRTLIILAISLLFLVNGLWALSPGGAIQSYKPKPKRTQTANDHMLRNDSKSPIGAVVNSIGKRSTGSLTSSLNRDAKQLVSDSEASDAVQTLNHHRRGVGAANMRYVVS